MAIFNSYVKLPEGTSWRNCEFPQLLCSFTEGRLWFTKANRPLCGTIPIEVSNEVSISSITFFIWAGLVKKEEPPYLIGKTWKNLWFPVEPVISWFIPTIKYRYIYHKPEFNHLYLNLAILGAPSCSQPPSKSLSSTSVSVASDCRNSQL